MKCKKIFPNSVDFFLFLLSFKYLFVFLHQHTSNEMTRPEVVQQISQTIHQVEPTATAILYGSEARGDARPDSDIDVLILLDGEHRDLKRENHLSDELYDIELSSGVLISPMIMLRKQWENRPFKTPFYINVMNEGKRI